MTRRRGKYTGVVENLPRLNHPDPNFQESVDAMKRELTEDPDFKMTAPALTSEYIHLRQKKDALKASLSELEIKLEAVTQLMGAQYEAEDIKAVNSALGYRVGCYLEPYAQVTDREAFYNWCMADPDLRRKMSLSWQTTNAISKERLTAGEPEPPGVTTFSKLKVRMEKSE